MSLERAHEYKKGYLKALKLGVREPTNKIVSTIQNQVLVIGGYPISNLEGLGQSESSPPQRLRSPEANLAFISKLTQFKARGRENGGEKMFSRRMTRRGLFATENHFPVDLERPILTILHEGTL